MEVKIKIDKIKIIVAHPAQQHSYKTALALKEKKMLYKYITTVYNKKNSITSLVTKFMRGDNKKRAAARRNNKIDSDVLQINEIGGLILLLLQRIDKKKYLYSKFSLFLNNKFGKKIAKIAIKDNVDAVIVYDTVSLETIEILEKRSPDILKIIDMSAPNLLYMDKIFKNDLIKHSPYNDTLKTELNSDAYKLKLLKAEKEIKKADYFLVASTFTKKSLLYSGIKEEQIIYAPYGIQKNNSLNFKRTTNKLNVLFVGRVTQKKGAFYLFDAINILNPSKYIFTFAGAYDETNRYYTEFKDKCNFVGHITKEKMQELYKKSDVLVFPSLADGFGLSVVEALSHGVPVICSENTGAKDLIEDGYNGFKIPIADSKSIYKKLEWFYNHKEKLAIMKKNSVESVKKYSWENYNDVLAKQLTKIIENEKRNETKNGYKKTNK